MIKWKEIDCARRNKLLYGGAGLLLLLAWPLAFRKTYDAYREHARLQALVGDDISHGAQHQLAQKAQLLDSLTRVYRADSAQWDDGFLSEASRAISGPGVQVYYNNNRKSIATADSSGIRTKKLTLKGNFRAIVQAVSELERISTLGYLNTVNLALDNRRTPSNEKKMIEAEVGFGVVE